MLLNKLIDWLIEIWIAEQRLSIGLREIASHAVLIHFIQILKYIYIRIMQRRITDMKFQMMPMVYSDRSAV